MGPNLSTFNLTLGGCQKSPSLRPRKSPAVQNVMRELEMTEARVRGTPRILTLFIICGYFKMITVLRRDKFLIISHLEDRFFNIFN